MTIALKYKSGHYIVDTTRRSATRIKGQGILQYTQEVKKRELLDALLAQADASEQSIR